MAENGIKGDRMWLVLCTCTGVAVDVTLNKYSALLPWYAVAGLWCVPAILFVIWFWRVEKASSWVKYQFLEHPVSYILMFLILVPFGWQATATVIGKISSPVSISRTTPNFITGSQGYPAASPETAAKLVPLTEKPTSKEEHKRPAVPPRLPESVPSSPTMTPLEQSCPNGICNGNGTTVGAPQTVDNRQFGVNQPPPNLLAVTTTPIEPSKDGKENDPGREGKAELNPGLEISFEIDRIFPNAMFMVACDRPCIGTQVQAKAGGAYSPQTYSTNQPNIAVFAPGSMTPLLANTPIELRVRSNDSSPIRIKEVVAYIPPVKR